MCFGSPNITLPAAPAAPEMPTGEGAKKRRRKMTESTVFTGSRGVANETAIQRILLGGGERR